MTAYDTLNQTYWVDHGLLLGYHRSGDILPHDGDVDLTRIHNKGLEKRFDDKVRLVLFIYMMHFAEPILL